MLRPSRKTNQNVRYCLALAAERTGVLLHAVCVMSNHWHGVVTDPEGRVPEFLEIFHKLLATAQNASLGRWENLWSTDKTSLVLPVNESDVLEKMACTLADPTVAGLVRSPEQWPGLISGRFGERREIEMPDVFFDDEGELPDSVALEFARPKIFPALHIDRCARVTLPRQILPGRSYLITRRCTQRLFLLRPSRVTSQIIEYCLALAAERTGVLLHAVCFMSNHWHGVLTDPEARLPEFLEIFHKLVAKAQNASLGRWENLWASGKTSVVLLVSDNDVLDKMAYTLANPTVAGLVKSPLDWPGVISNRFREQREVEMLDTFFNHEGNLPQALSLHFMRPQIFLGLTDAQLQARLNTDVAKLVRRARDDMALRGLPFVGRNAVLRQSFSAVPKTPAPRRNPSPRIAAKSTTERVHAIRRMLEFVRQYRDAWTQWRNGNRNALFPVGTYALRIYARVACAPAVPA